MCIVCACCVDSCPSWCNHPAYHINAYFWNFVCYSGWFRFLTIELMHAQSCPTLATPWTIAHQAPLSIGFFRQEYWSGLPFPPPGGSSQPKYWTCVFCSSPALAGGFLTTSCLCIPRFPYRHWPLLQPHQTLSVTSRTQSQLTFMVPIVCEAHQIPELSLW